MPGSSRGQVAELWRSLAPDRWPIPPEALPAGSALVGGAVRDGLLGRLANRLDLDVVVPGDAISLSRALARRHGGSCVVLDGDRSIARVVLHGWTLDLARCMGPDLETDLGRRDYSINAMALALSEPRDLLDPHGGLKDLERGELRAIRETNLLEDPLRLLRGIRLACELGFAIEPQTWGWICAHPQRLDSVAGERILAELERIAAAEAGEQGLARAAAAGLVPGHGIDQAWLLLSHCSAAWANRCGLSATERAAALPLARLAAVLDGAALERLRASRRLQQRCLALRQWRRRLIAVAGLDAGSALAARERANNGAPAEATGRIPSLTALPDPERLALHRQLEADLPALLLLLEPGEAMAALERWRDPGDPLFHPQPPLNGARLQQELGLKPGPILGQLLDHLSSERAFARLPRQASAAGHDEEVLTAARLWLAERGEWCG